MAPTAVEHDPKERFAFGKNWQGFLQSVDDERVAEAERSLREALGPDGLRGRRFLDVGSGSGLFSLAARRLGARCRSFDYDPSSVACTRELRRRYAPDDPDWTVEQGSVLDRSFLEGLGTHDVVYSWGVLHHTGEMWRALENVLLPLAPGGRLFIAIYNDQGARTEWYKRLKRTYVRSPGLGKAVIAGSYVGFQVTRGAVRDAIALRNPLRRYREKKKKRGMSLFHDWIDWVGGYPFEAAAPDAIVAFYRERGLALEHLRTCGGGSGCNEFVFAAP